MAVTQRLMISIIPLLQILALLSQATANNTYEDSHTPAATPQHPAKHAYPYAKTVDAVVEGMIYCQNCKYLDTWSLSEAKAIPGAKVGITCKNYKDRVSYYNVFTTNKDGFFYAELKGYKMRHPFLDHPLHACSVKLVSSPLEDCDVFSNINYGINGASLRYTRNRLFNKNYEAVIYAAEPLAFRPENCAPTEY